MLVANMCGIYCVRENGRHVEDELYTRMWESVLFALILLLFILLMFWACYTFLWLNFALGQNERVNTCLLALAHHRNYRVAYRMDTILCILLIFLMTDVFRMRMCMIPVLHIKIGGEGFSDLEYV